MRIGRISYLNVEPFFHAFPWPVAVTLPPRALGEAVAAGDVDAGPLALADGIRLGSVVSLLPYGVATAVRAQSVLLFSNGPMSGLGGRRIAVTAETATSVRLLRIFLAFREQVDPPTLVGLGEPADGVLLIGDAALATRRGPWPHPYCLDLGEEWTRWTGLPCVFAAWAVRSTVAADARAELMRLLGESLDEGLRRLPVIARARRDTGLSEAEVVAYLGGFTYRIGPAEEEAIGEFRRLLQLLGES